MNNDLASIIKRQIKRVFFLLSAFLFLIFFIFQIFNTYSYLETTKDNLNQWLTANKPQLAEALFLENIFSLKGNIATLNTHDITTSEKRITIFDKNGNVVYGASDNLKKYLKNKKYGFSINTFKLTLQYFDPIFFADQKQGYILVDIKKNLSGLISQSIIFILFCLTLFVFFRVLLQLIIKKIRTVALDPIIGLSKSMISSSEKKQPSQFKISSLDTAEEINDLIKEYNALVTQLQKVTLQLKEEAALAAIGQLAKQVAHDIRSPLAALTMVSQTLLNVEESKRTIIRKATARINDIANDLLTKEKTNIPENNESLQANETKSVALLSSLLDNIVTEKRMQYRDKGSVEICLQFSQKNENSGYGLFASIQPKEFNRVISNLINNAVEAIDNNGKIQLFLKQHDNKAVIEIHDNGKGIPENILPYVMEKHVSHGKEENNTSGSGLGLYHAKKTIASWGGKITIHSVTKENMLDGDTGTTVIIELNKVSPPTWFVPKINLIPEMKIIILDDDTSIHQIWKHRFSTLRLQTHQIEENYFSTPENLYEWHREHIKCKNPNQSITDNLLFLIDYEFLGRKINGLDIIRSLNIQEKSILVTSRHEELHVKQVAEELKVSIIPKELAGFVPIIITP